MPFVYQLRDWPQFRWDPHTVIPVLTTVRHGQGRLMGQMDGLGFRFKEEAILRTLTEDVIKSSEIEGEHLSEDQVRSSIARRLGMDIGELIPADRDVEGVVEMMLDATQRYHEPLTEDRLFGWHAALFPSGRSGMHKITTGTWRQPGAGSMQVVSGPMGRERVHFQAPEAEAVPHEMALFLDWFNTEERLDPVLKAAIAHLWFVTIHPFDDGNGRIARAITDMQLARSDGSTQRFYSMSGQIRKERNRYYDILESTQKGSLDVTDWLLWFLECLNTALQNTNETLQTVLAKARFWERHAATAMYERQKLMVNKLLDGFDGKLTSTKWGKIAKCSHDTALRDIKDLLDKGVLVKEPGGSKNTSYALNLEPKKA